MPRESDHKHRANKWVEIVGAIMGIHQWGGYFLSNTEQFRKEASRDDIDENTAVRIMGATLENMDKRDGFVSRDVFKLLSYADGENLRETIGLNLLGRVRDDLNQGHENSRRAKIGKFLSGNIGKSYPCKFKIVDTGKTSTDAENYGQRIYSLEWNGTLEELEQLCALHPIPDYMFPSDEEASDFPS